SINIVAIHQHMTYEEPRYVFLHYWGKGKAVDLAQSVNFAMHENELQTVLKTMRGQSINIVAIHQHMTYEEPRYVFLHYWGKGKAVDL
ncbi:DUF1259 domain-containing protein, partial [Escherichia coli]|uniref:DUF1259 domain-containing protein n=1 Tax=Escherichia coli TaxID=562 RepID=UPI001BC87583